ncbi:hypothetical protein A2124_03405 [Candidatus Woesebacteria bacterium GWB1_37_5]|nr:MAG: hypothetical protein A2124_03405 [Candidatus Woesebacteria bacterium GWB1_37_5]
MKLQVKAQLLKSAALLFQIKKIVRRALRIILMTIEVTIGTYKVKFSRLTKISPGNLPMKGNLPKNDNIPPMIIKITPKVTITLPKPKSCFYRFKNSLTVIPMSSIIPLSVPFLKVFPECFGTVTNL